MSLKIPDRWMDYESMGTRIGDTHFIAFKRFTNDLPLEKQFTPHDLMNKLPDLSLVIDLTYTTKYYSCKIFRENNVEYFKIMCPGHVIPSNHLLRKFFNVVDQFLLKNSQNDSVLIGVHCTHGINRTGYFICSYLINKLGYSSEKAISEFNAARGYDIERTNYLKALKRFDRRPIVFNEKLENEECKNGEELKNEEHKKRKDRREYKNCVQQSYYRPYHNRVVRPPYQYNVGIRPPYQSSVGIRPPFQNNYGSRNARPYLPSQPYTNDPFYGNLYAWNRRGRQNYNDQFWKD